MTAFQSPAESTVGVLVRSALPAFVLALPVGFALRLTGASAGVRTGAMFFVFMVLQNVVFDQLSGARRTPGKWVATVAAALGGGIAMWLIADL